MYVRRDLRKSNGQSKLDPNSSEFRGKRRGRVGRVVVKACPWRGVKPRPEFFLKLDSASVGSVVVMCGAVRFRPM
jgi:hypothetical protein